MARAGAPFIARCDLSAVAAQPRRRNSREGGTERVPQDVHALFDARDALSVTDGFDHAIARDR
jgi:hypothetical protein